MNTCTFASLQKSHVGSVILLTGNPGSGKSTFCYQMAVRAVADQYPTIFVTTEQTIDDLVVRLRAQGLGAYESGIIAFVDAFSETVGVRCRAREGAESGNCADLNSLSIAISKQRRQWPDKDILLLFDSLTSPYLFNGMAIVRFMQHFLAKFAVEGNAVLAAVDEDCGKQEDMGAMRSIVDGIVRLSIQDTVQTAQIIKHPTLPISITERGIVQKPWSEAVVERLTPEIVDKFGRSFFGDEYAVRPTAGDFVNAIWPNMAHWSGMLWDPKRYPLIIYQHNREDQELTGTPEHLQFLPRRFKLMFKAMFASRSIGLLPRYFDDVGDLRKLWRFGFPYRVGGKVERSGAIQFLSEKSSKDEYHYRIDDCSDCWGFDGVGVTMASHLPPSMAGQLMAFEENDRVWTAVETKCIGLGDPYCEVKLTPGESGELEASLVKDAVAIERIHECLTQQFVAGLIHEQTQVNRPTFGNGVHLQVAFHAFGFPKIAGQRSTMAMRMGGAKLGSQVGEGFKVAGTEPSLALERFLGFLNSAKVGIAEFQTETSHLRISENIEPLHTWYFTEIREPSCYFTTGFLSGLYKSLTGQRVRETKCIAAGHRHCEWEVL